MNELPAYPPDTLSEKDMRALSTLLVPPRKKMPLSVFEKDFLPFLSTVPVPQEVTEALLARMSRQTGVEHNVRDLTGNLLNEWMEYHQSVGAPYMFVDVMSGEDVVYTVPPLLDGNVEVLKEGVDARLLTTIANHSSDLSLIHATLADNFIKDSLLPLVTKAVANPDFLKMWNIIYTYHGLPLLTLEDNQFKVSGVVAPQQQKVGGTTIEADGSISEFDEYD